MADVFISYAAEDRARVEPIVETIEEAGFSVWWDRRIGLGSSFEREIELELDSARCVVVVWSKESIKSDWVRNEAQEGLDRGVLLPILIEDVKPPLAFRRAQSAKLFGQGGSDELRRVVASIGSIATGRRASVVTTEVDAQSPLASAQNTGPAREEMAKSIAVLPFENMSPDPERSYFAAGIHGEIINQLSKVRDLAVIARTTMTTYANTGKSIPEIGKELRVSSVMEGSVRYSGSRVRITAQLIDANSGTQLWSDAYEAELEDIFDIQLAIASRLSEALEAEFSASERASVGDVVTSNPEAYSQYLLGMSLTGNFAPMAPVHEALEKAVALDPEFAEAYAFNAMMYGFEANYAQFTGASFNAYTSLRNSQLAFENAQRALSLDPDQPFALLATGAFERAYRINPK